VRIAHPTITKRVFDDPLYVDFYDPDKEIKTLTS
jgi:hypothetical protein